MKSLAEHCVHLTNVNFGGCDRLSDASVVALAEHWNTVAHLTNVHFSKCDLLTDASVTALAVHCGTDSTLLALDLRQLRLL